MTRCTQQVLTLPVLASRECHSPRPRSLLSEQRMGKREERMWGKLRSAEEDRPKTTQTYALVKCVLTQAADSGV